MTASKTKEDLDRTTHIVLDIKSLFRSPVGFSYESNVASLQESYKLGLKEVVMTDVRSNQEFEIKNPYPKDNEYYELYE